MITDMSALGLVALIMVLGYYLIHKMTDLAAKHYERQELILQNILIQQMACAEELVAIKESFRSFGGSR